MKQWTDNQKKAIETIDSNLIVSASAGSGKTSAMVERAIFLITTQKVPIEKIMLLTFSNNSAREMKERLRLGLVAYAKEHEESVAFIREQLDNLSLADISTIDSFCLKLTQEFFEVVGLSPSVGIQSPEEEKEDVAKADENTIKRCEQDEKILEMMDKLSLRKDDSFLDIIHQTYKYLTVQPDRAMWIARCLEMYDEKVDFEHSVISTFPAEYLAKTSRIYASELRKIYTEAGLNLSDNERKKEADYLLRVLASIEPFEHTQTLKELYEAYNSSISNTATPRGKLDKTLISSITNIRDEFSVFKKKLSALFPTGESYEKLVCNRNEAGKHVVEILKAVSIFSEEYDKIKSEQNKIDFADMERYAMEILKNEDIANEVIERHEFVFVDEYQDTNYLQDAIIRRVTHPERLFVVGDVKQCIYRFRLAEPKIFLNTLSDWQCQGKAVFFNDNFRSDNVILDFVNHIFDLLMTSDFGNVDYKNSGHFSIRENKIQSEISPVTILQPFSKEVCKDKKKKDNLKDSENKDGEEHNEGKKPFADENGVYDIAKHKLNAVEKDTSEAGLIYDYIQSVLGKKIYVKGEERRVCYSDIALMYRNRSSPKGTLEVLQKGGIPLNMGDFEGEIGEKELDVFMDYIQVIDNLYDDYYLLSALHSFIGGLSNLELATIKQKAPRKSSFYETCLAYITEFDDEIKTKLKKFFSVAEKYRFLSSTIELSAFLKQVFEECGYATYLASQNDGERIISAINGYFDNVEGKRYSRDLHSFILHYRKTDSIELKSQISDANGVNVTTIHSSKGLEYPIVIFAGLDGKEQSDSAGIVSDIDFGVGVKYYNPEDRSINDTLDMKIIAMKKKKEEREDQLRLLYVALTRAQSALCLIMPANVKSCVYPFSNSSFAKWIDFAVRNSDFVSSLVVKSEPHIFDKTQTFERVCPEILEAPEELKKRLEYVYPHEIATKTARKYSVSALSSGEKTLSLPSFDAEEESFAGTAHHLVMQYIDMFARSHEEIKKEIDRLLSENILEKGQYDEIEEQEIYDCLNSFVGDLARAGECYREQKFVLAKKGDEVLSNGYQENVLVQGIIDLLIVGDEIVVVDFKRSKASKETLLARYTTQLKLYADAVKETFGKYPDKLLLYVFGKNEIIEIK